MIIKTHQINGFKIAELVSDEVLIKTSQDGTDVLGNLYYQDFDRIIIQEKNIISDFFDLKNGLAGEILQKFSNFRVRLAVVGDFNKYSSRSFNDFMHESNKGKHVVFVSSVIEGLNILSH